MLSRVADSLYWMSRYLERAEHTARLVDVNLTQMLDQTPATAEQRWERLLAALQVTLPPEQAGDAYRIAQALTFDAALPASIMACIAVARENARQVRQQISTEMWEQLNRLYLRVRHTSMDSVWNAEPHEFFQAVKEGSHLFQGITDATMSHGEGWQFIQIGRSIERAQATALALDVNHRALRATSASGSDESTYLEWVALLKSFSAFEAYCQVYTADVHPDQIAEFVLLNEEFPRSVRFAADTVETALQAISRATGSRGAARAERFAGRLRAALGYAQVEEIMADSFHTYLETIQQQCAQIHLAIHQVYIAYPIDTALAG